MPGIGVIGQISRKVPYRFLMVDGTKVRLQEVDQKGHGKKVEMRWALASLEEKGKFDLVGIWIGKSWQKIRRDLNQRLNYSNLEVLFSDGGPGIEENLLAPGMRHQRCLWHGKRDFPYILYLDKLKKPQQKELKEKLKSIPAMNLRRSDLEQLTPEDLPRVKELAQKTKQGFKELLDALPEEKYPAARAYIQNLSQSVTTFFEFWFANKLWIPLNTNAVESCFSQVKNRIWAVGKRWGEPGLTNWLKVVVNKVFFPLNWNQLWAEYLHIDSNLQINLTEVKYQWL
ncbi:transposase [Thermodesulfovibrionales bacterium]|nr:transposase [Thermodesulfovibrionales bacterium]